MICNDQQNCSTPQAVKRWIATLRLPRRLASSLRAGCSFHFSEDTKLPPLEVYAKAKLRGFLPPQNRQTLLHNILTNKVMVIVFYAHMKQILHREEVFLDHIQAKAGCRALLT